MLAILGAPDASACPTGYSCGICSEAVNNYSNLPLNPSLNNSIANNQGLWEDGSGNPYGLADNGGGPYPAFTLDLEYTDNEVWDTDFRDPDVSGDPSASIDNDTSNFDWHWCAVSYYKGHGGSLDGDGYTEQPCSLGGWQCTNPPDSHYPDASCSSYFSLAGAVDSRCIYDSAPNIRLNDNSASGSGSAPNNSPNRGQLYFHNKYVPPSTYPLRFGESASSGAWAGAGTNGGANAVFLDMSYPVVPGFTYEELDTLMAGAHWLGVAMPTGGDTDDAATRGSTWAHQFTVNPYGAPASEWLNTINRVREGGACGTADGSQGGFGGINGCGCSVVYSDDSSYSRAAAHVQTENWGGLQWDGNDAQGQGNPATGYQCNYDTTVAFLYRR